MSGETGKKRGLRKRILALLTVLCMAFTLAPAVVLADTAGNGNSVTVYVSVSDDGEFVVGNDPDKTVMMRVPVTVDYFDLAEYGLEKFYRYEADENGEYIGDKVIEQPTLLHCYIRILERFYLGGQKLDLEKHGDALTIGGTSSPTSLYMTQFWGHDENLMYFVDHQYPLMRQGWGATSDWILLEDGMEIDLAMFSDWNFYHYGAFAWFDTTEKTILTGDTLNLTMLGTETGAPVDGSVSIGVPMMNEKVKVSADGGRTWSDTGSTTDSSGNVSLKFDEVGTYYVSAGPLYNTYKSESGDACVAPPACKVIVRDPVAVEGVRISHDSLTLEKGESQRLVAAVTPQDASNKRILWTSSDDGIASVDRTGLVTAKETGTATITAAAEDNGMMKAECAVTVKETLEPVPEPEPAITAPAAPAGVKAASYNYKSLKLSWKLVSGASGYQVYRASSQNGKYALVKTTAASAFVNKGLTTGKNYYYKVRAYKKVGSKTVYGGFSKTAGAKPALKAPAKVRAKAGKKKITVQWKKTDGATGYKVYRATKKNGKYKAVKTIKKQRTVKFTNKKLKKGKKYYYKVRAFRTVNGKKVYGSYSKRVSAKAR